MNFKITGEYSHDLTQTGMTGLFDRMQGNLSDELLGYFKIDREKLPRKGELIDIYRVKNSVFKGVHF